MRIYLDSCCYNRPFDDLSQYRVHLEADAILTILAQSLQGKISILRSAALTAEIEAISNANRRWRVLYMYNLANGDYITSDKTVISRTSFLQQHGLHAMDAAHIALAEKGKAAIFFTVDDKLLRACNRLTMKMRVSNPLNYVKEVLENESEY